jgi:glucose uptake protein GlcU
MLFCSTLGALCHYHYGASFVSIFCVIMGVCAGLMILPGIYLYIVKGCRPEDCDEVPAARREQDMDQKENGLVVFWLVTYSLAFVYGLWTSGTFRCVIGLLAVVMILPGTYLFVRGSRPEDYEEVTLRTRGQDMGQKESGLIVSCLALYGLAFVYGLWTYGTFRCVIGLLAAVMILPGTYLFVCGYRPEDCDEALFGKCGTDIDNKGSRMAAFWLAIYSLAFSCALWTSGTFRCLLGSLAAVMILPGIYLFVFCGCRPEDCDDKTFEKQVNDKKESGAAVFWLAMYSLAFSYALLTSGTFRCLLGSLAAVMILPGTYLFVLGGCRPEDANED